MVHHVLRLVVIAVWSFMLFFSVHSAEIQVAPDTDGGLVRAILTASAGDVVRLSPGTYTGVDNCGAVMDKPGLTLLGSGAELTVIDCVGAETRCLSILPPCVNCRVQDVALTNGGSSVSRRQHVQKIAAPARARVRGKHPSELTKLNALRDDANDSCEPAEPEFLGCMAEDSPKIHTAQCGSLTDGSADKYERDSDCTWHIDPPGAVSLIITFTRFDVEMDGKCQWDSLELIETNNGGQVSIGRFCGTSLSDYHCVMAGDEACNSNAADLTNLHVGAPLTIRFKSDNTEQRDGFALTWVSSPDAPPNRGGQQQGSETGPLPHGGGVAVEAYLVTLHSVRVSGNFAKRGGGIAVIGPGASLILENSVVRGNTGRFGGGLYQGDGAACTLRRSHIVDNEIIATIDCSEGESLPLYTPDASGDAIAAAGGAVFSHGGSLSLFECLISNNIGHTTCYRNAVWGGGIFVRRIEANDAGTDAVDPVVNIQGGTIAHNTISAFDGLGGGVSCFGCRVDISGTIMLGNHIHADMRGNGGALYAAYSNVSLAMVDVRSNIAQTISTTDSVAEGGGVSASYSNLHFDNSHFVNNTVDAVTSSGGAVELLHTSLHARRCNLSQNIARGFRVSGAGVSGRHIPHVWLQECDMSQSVLDGKFMAGGALSCVKCVNITLIDVIAGHGNCVGGDPIMGGAVYVASSILHGTRLDACCNEVKTGSPWSGSIEGGSMFALASQVVLIDSDLSHNIVNCIGIAGEVHGGGYYGRETDTTLVGTNINFNHVNVSERGSADGGGVYSKDGNMTVSRCRVSNNTIDSGLSALGGGMFVDSSGGDVLSPTVVVSHSVFSGNNITAFNLEAHGAGMFLVNPGHVQIRETNITDGTVTGTLCDDTPANDTGVDSNIHDFGRCRHAFPRIASGGGVYFTGSKVTASSLLIQSSVIRDNTVVATGATHGGGVFFQALWSTKVMIKASLIAGNRVACVGRCLYFQEGVAGGGVYAGNARIGNDDVSVGVQMLTILDTIVVDNVVSTRGYRSKGVGGGLCLYCEATVMKNSTFSNNHVLCDGVQCQSRGGGVFYQQIKSWTTPQYLKMVSCHANRNVVRSMGGGDAGGGGLYDDSTPTDATSMISTELQANTVQCQGAMSCRAYGGGLHSVASHLLITDVMCMENMVTGGRSAGGCIHVQGDRAHRHIDTGRFSSNIVLGQLSAAGGAMYASDVGHVTAKNIQCDRNHAGTGACCSVTGALDLLVENSTIAHNVARGVAGGFSVIDGSHLSVVGSLLWNNTAPAAAVIFSNTETSRLSFTDSYMPLGDGVMIMVNGQEPLKSLLDAREASRRHTRQQQAQSVGRSQTELSVFACMNRGSGETIQRQQTFVTVSCSPCKPGTFALGSDVRGGQCLLCPYGGRCMGGNGNDTGLAPLPGFWGRVQFEPEGDSVTFHRCPPAYCCRQQSQPTECPFDHCQGGRRGLLCGKCKDDAGLQLFSAVCRNNTECNDAAVFYSMMFVVCCMFVGIMVVLSHRQSSGYSAVLVFFYQAATFCRPHSWQYVTPWIADTLFSLFNLSPTGTTGGEAQGLCVAQGMTAAQKIVLERLFPAFVLAVHPLVYAMHLMVRRLQILVPRLSRLYLVEDPKIELYAKTATRTTSMGLTSMVLGCLQLLQCRRMDGELRWWWDADEICFSAWQVGPVFVLLPLLILPILALLWIIKRSAHYALHDGEATTCPRATSGPTLHRVRHHVMVALQGGFSHKMAFWVGVSLYRRLTLVFMFVFITDPQWQAIVIAWTCLVFVIANLLCHPFRLQQVHHSETFSLMILCILSISSIPDQAKVALGSPTPLVGAEVMEWLQLVLIVSPLVVVPFLRYRHQHQHQRGRHHQAILSSKHRNGTFSIVSWLRGGTSGVSRQLTTIDGSTQAPASRSMTMTTTPNVVRSIVGEHFQNTEAHGQRDAHANANVIFVPLIDTDAKLQSQDSAACDACHGNSSTLAVCHTCIPVESQVQSHAWC